ncbi:ABC transporter ATP-binding protein [Polaromonas sp.]|nr:ABC transporter ATP-binding protein [Candidatus Saccharibacteria bacterium]
MATNIGKYRLVYGHLWQTFGATWEVRVSYVLQLLSRICKLIALPVALSLIITHLSQHDYAGARRAVLIYVIFSSLLGLITPLVRYIAMRGENKVYSQLTASYFDKLVNADLEYFNSNLTGYLTTATRQYVDSCVQLTRSLRDRYSATILSIVFPLGVILWLDVPLGLVTLALSIANAAYMIWASHLIGPLRTKSREQYRHNSGKMADITANILAIKATGQETNYVAAVRQAAEEEASTFFKRYGLQAKLVAAREAITVVVFATLFTLTVNRIAEGYISLTTAVLVITYAATILTGIYSLSDDLDEHDDLIDKVIPAFEILNRQNHVVDPVEPLPLTQVKGAISFDSVWFSYERGSKHRAVLEDFSLSIPEGQKLGVVGLSGAGKSTLTKLLLRFTDTDKGRILIDEIDITTVRQAELRTKIAYVPQEPLLLHTTIRENVLLSRPGASNDDVVEALKTAHALDFVQVLPDGLNSVVGERGVKLSGGQKQRIAIARAMLQNAPIIVLDEATSALDSESEQIIKDSFNDILKGRTAIVVAHRLSTLSHMDRIIVISKGRIVEDGSHHDLLAHDELYAKLWQRQQNKK